MGAMRRFHGVLHRNRVTGKMPALRVASASCRFGTASESSVKPCSSFFRNPLATRDHQIGGGELVIAGKASTRWLSQSGQPAGRSLRVFSGAVAISLTVVASTDAGSMESEFIQGCVCVATVTFTDHQAKKMHGNPSSAPTQCRWKQRLAS